MRALILLVGLAALPVWADELDDLLQSVRQGQQESRVVNEGREARFLREKGEQAALLQEARTTVRKLEKQAEGRRKTFSENEKALSALRSELGEKSGDLQQLESVFRQAAADAHSLLADSLVTSQIPDRLEVLAQLSTADRLPAPADIESLWFELQREMTENGRIATFETEIFDPDGRPRRAAVQRIGLFAARSGADYLEYRSGDRRLELLRRQPGDSGPLSLLGGTPEGVVLLDPTRGNLFGLLVERPTLRERVRQGGFVGLLIIGLGCVGMLLVIYQLIYLLRVGQRVRRQLAQPREPRADNPLGRILLAHAGLAAHADLETVELQLDEAILKETPKLERLQGTIKLLAAVAPLMGLLGTVTGMIETFQAITLFGTGDPKLMASGISQALVTTVLGLVVAIPLLFLHSLVATRGRTLIQILDEQTAGLVARGQERAEAPADA